MVNRSAVLELFGEFDYVTYYTVRLMDNGRKHDLSETDKFYERFDNEDDPHYDEFAVLVTIIDAIGNHRKGAEAHFFRFENAANSLPPKRSEAKRAFEIEVVMDSVLRLYCIRLTNGVVVLLNGGVKTKDNAQDCPNVALYFKFAQAVAKAIDGLIRDRSIRIEQLEIINDSGEDEIILDLN